jgi:hypothetical protein
LRTWAGAHQEFLIWGVGDGIGVGWPEAINNLWLILKPCYKNPVVNFVIALRRLRLTLMYIRGLPGKLKYITCSPTGKFFMLIVATLPSTLIIYLWAVLVWQRLKPALFEWDVFEMAAPIQSPAKMRGAFRHKIYQRERWTSGGNSQTNCCCLW